ncbi:MAG: hypothetical protein QF510_08270, partial [Rhodospirillales bacterium]|nr:hypothetical protein [Rhodospirillales bacterium]
MAGPRRLEHGQRRAQRPRAVGGVDDRRFTSGDHGGEVRNLQGGQTRLQLCVMKMAEMDSAGTIILPARSLLCIP